MLPVRMSNVSTMSMRSNHLAVALTDALRYDAFVPMAFRLTVSQSTPKQGRYLAEDRMFARFCLEQSKNTG
jgi:hypothetical protein